MNQDQPQLTLDDSVKQVMQTLPPVIRAYLAEGRYTEVAKNMMTKYSLRIDQGGVLEREIMLLLMGVENPAEFIQTLTEEAKMDEQTIMSIMQDINTQIFVPLQEEMKKGGVSVPQSPKPVIPQLRPQTVVSPQRVAQPRPVNASVPRYSPPTPTPMGSYAPPLQSPMYARPITTPSPASVPQKNFTRPVQSVRPPVSSTLTRPAMITAPKPVDNGQLLEDHEEPHIEFKKAPTPLPVRNSYSVPRVPSDVPKREANPARVMPPPAAGFPKGSVPPNLPGAMPPSGIIPPGGRPTFMMPQMPAIPAPAVTSRPTPPAPPVLPQKTPAPPAPKSYSADPYREPVDGE